MRHKILLAVLFGLLIFGCISVPETDPPRDLEISVEEGKYTAETGITLSLFATDASECRFSNNAQEWSNWESYKIQKKWTLPEGDGLKQVFYQCKNGVSQLSIPVSVVVYLDSAAPEITLLSPLEGQEYAGRFNLVFIANNSISNTLNCSAKLNNDDLEIGIVGAGKKQNITLYAPSGEYTLTLNCRDNVLSSEKSVAFEVVYGPVVGIMISDGSGYTDTRNVSLSLSSATASECRFSNNADDWSDWMPYASAVQWQLTEGDGTKTVYAECKNERGTLSTGAYDTIVLDSSPPPYISLSINNGVAWTNSRDVMLGLYAFAASECRYSNDGETWSDWEAYKRKKTWALSEGEGEKEVYYDCRKKTGEEIGIATSAIKYSIVPSEPPFGLEIVINDETAYTSSEILELKLNAVGAYECRFRENELDWTDWEEYKTKKIFTLSGNDGAKTIYYQCRNDYGRATVYDRIYLDRSPPAQVKVIKAEASEFAAHIRWSVVADIGSGVSYYTILRKADGLWFWVGSSEKLSYKDERVVPGETYEYKVNAVDYNLNQGQYSEVVSVTIPAD